MKTPQRYMITPNILYYDIYGRLEGKEKFREQFLLAVYEPENLKELCLSLSFGKKEKCLTLLEEGKEIRCTSGYGWSCKRTVEEKEQKIYWNLEKKEEDRKYYEPYLWVLFSNISIRKAGIAYLEITCGEQAVHEYIPIVKEQLKPRITRFSPVTATIREGQTAVLEWETCGARKCVLNPGNIYVDTFGTMEVQPKRNMVYTLDAIGTLEQEKVSKSARVYLYEESMGDYLIAQPESYYQGSSITIFYKIGEQEKHFDVSAGKFYLVEKNGMEICSEEIGETADGSLRFEISSEKTITAYKGQKKKMSVTVYPDERQVIMRYTVSPIKQGSQLSFSLGWITKGAKEIQIFVRVYSLENKKAVNGFCNDVALITSEEEEGMAVWSSDKETGHAKYFFFLRTKNVQGERKEAVYVYEDEKEIGRYDNLGK